MRGDDVEYAPVRLLVAGVAAPTGSQPTWASGRAWAARLTSDLGVSARPLLMDIEALRSALADPRGRVDTEIGGMRLWLWLSDATEPASGLADALVRLAGTGTLAACGFHVVEPHGHAVDP